MEILDVLITGTERKKIVSPLRTLEHQTKLAFSNVSWLVHCLSGVGQIGQISVVDGSLGWFDETVFSWIFLVVVNGDEGSVLHGQESNGEEDGPNEGWDFADWEDDSEERAKAG